MRRILVVLSLIVLLVLLGGIAEPPESELVLTIYGHDIALVTELRTINLEAGLTTVRLLGLPRTLIPSSVHLESLAGGLAVLEREFRYEPLSAPTLLARFIGKEIEVRVDGAIYRGRLLSTERGGVIIQDRAGNVQIIAAPDGFILPSLPHFGVEPALVLLVDSEHAGEAPLRLRYLARGLRWEAYYTAILTGEAMTLHSVVSVTNNSGRNFENVRLQLVAGEPQRVAAKDFGLVREMAALAAEEAFVAAKVFEYHVYTLDRPATIIDGRVKEFAFISAPAVRIERHYIFAGQVRDGVWAGIEFVNSQPDGLGRALPAGTIRFHQDGLFIGEARIPHTPVDEPVSLTVGRAFDLVGERVRIEHRRPADRRHRDTFRITLRNRKAEDVVIRVQESLRGDWTILQASLPHEQIDATTIEFAVPVPAGEEVEVVYTVESRF